MKESSGAEGLSIAVRTFMNKARTDSDWTRALITVVRYAEGMRSTLATYLRADLQAGRRQGDFHYAHEEMAMSMVISATLGAMNLLVEDGEAEHADRIAAEMVLQALGVPSAKAKWIAGLLGCRCRGRVNSAALPQRGWLTCICLIWLISKGLLKRPLALRRWRALVIVLLPAMIKYSEYSSSIDYISQYVVFSAGKK